MACLIPKRVVNPRYKKIAPDTHFRLYHETLGQYPKDDYYVSVNCGRCINCLKRDLSSWRFRLIEHIRSLSTTQLKKSYFVTLTLNPRYYTDSKTLLKRYVRLFLDRVRKKIGHSISHFLITERGDLYGRIHFHGFFFDTDLSPSLIGVLWKYGFVQYTNLFSVRNISQKVSYITTYITTSIVKDSPHKVFTPEELPLKLVSPGIGKSYASRRSSFHQTNLFPFTYDQSHLYPLPRYLRQKVFTEDQLKTMSKDYFRLYSDDVIPDPPYFIGSRKYIDYSLYLRDLKPIINTYHSIYGK